MVSFRKAPEAIHTQGLHDIPGGMAPRPLPPSSGAGAGRRRQDADPGMKRLDVLKVLRRLRKPFYTLSDMQKILGVPRSQAKVEVFRLIRSGVLERLATNVYVSPWNDPNLERVASQLYTPCYLSFESALSQWGILSQIPY